ncbi:MAG: hypothetical protein ACI3V0_08535 [Faecousia sp.]
MSNQKKDGDTQHSQEWEIDCGFDWNINCDLSIPEINWNFGIDWNIPWIDNQEDEAKVKQRRTTSEAKKSRRN